MEWTRIVFLAIGVLIAASAIILPGCTAPRSNTRLLAEHVSLAWVPAQSREAVVPESIGIAEIGAAAADLGLKAIGKLIDWEADKYTASFAADARVSTGVGAAGGWQPAVVVFARTVAEHDGNEPTDFELEVWTKERATEVVAEIHASVVHQCRLAKDGGIGLSGFEEGLKNHLAAALPVGRATTLLAVFAVVPFEEVYEVVLLGHYAGGTKAKALSWSVPFLQSDATETLLELGIRGPRGLGTVRDYEVSAEFRLGGDRGARAWVATDLRDAGNRSELFYAEPKVKAATCRVQAVETNRGGELLKELKAAIVK